MPFRTKLDYSDNRQIKQRVRTETVLSGATQFGVPFSAMTSGPDESTTFVTATVDNVNSTFSGNSGTTIWSFGDSRMSIASGALSAITPSNSGVTQDTDDVFVADTTTVIDGNTVNLTYTGVSFGMEITGMTDMGGGIYTGAGSTQELEILSADTLDFTGRTIWVDVPEILRTKKLIITEGVIAGYVLKADSEGMGTWQPDASGTTVPLIYNQNLPEPNTSIQSAFGVSSIDTGSTFSNIIGGDDNFILSSATSNIIGGSGNTIDTYQFGVTVDLGHHTIVGGEGNIIKVLGEHNFVGGHENSITGQTSRSSIVGGKDNIIDGFGGGKFIGGGNRNIVSGINSSVVGGADNIGGGQWSFIGGGNDNVASSRGSVVGGENNFASQAAFVGGGYNNTTIAWSSVVGGRYNNAQSYSTFVGGGTYNTITGSSHYSIIGGGEDNLITDNSLNSVLVGGLYNYIDNSEYGFIGGGSFNVIDGSTYSSIVGGKQNTMSGSSSYSTIIGGEDNVIDGVSNSHIIGSNITATTANTTYVNDLVIDSISTGTTNELIGILANGTLIKNPVLTMADDDIDAGLSGVTQGQFYQLSGGGAGVFSGLTGVVIIKQ